MADGRWQDTRALALLPSAICRLLCTLAASALCVAGPTAAQDRLLTLHDVSPDLAQLIGGTELDFVAKAKIGYGVTGRSTYDHFFRESAVSYGGMTVGRGLTDDATIKLKGYARNKAAIAELDAQIREITGGAPPEQWTTEQSLAVLQAAKEKDRLSDEENEYILASSARVAATIPVVHASVAASKDLLGQVNGLVSGAPSAFGMLRAPGVVSNLNRSADRIRRIPTEGTTLIESLTVLSRGLSMLSGQ
jgi:hypothetical protein